jgi:hypothetical protein
VTTSPGEIAMPPAHSPVVPLALPLFVSAGHVGGIAFAFARDANELWYLVDHAAVDGPPVWVHEGQIEKCFVAPLPVRERMPASA